MSAGGNAQTGLNTADGGVALDQQGQHLTVEQRRAEEGRRCGQERLVQGLEAVLNPGVEGLARDAKLAAEERDAAIVTSVSDHVADGLDALCRADIMALNHRVPLKGW